MPAAQVQYQKFFVCASGWLTRVSLDASQTMKFDRPGLSCSGLKMIVNKPHRVLLQEACITEREQHPWSSSWLTRLTRLIRSFDPKEGFTNVHVKFIVSTVDIRSTCEARIEVCMQYVAMPKNHLHSSQHTCPHPAVCLSPSAYIRACLSTASCAAHSLHAVGGAATDTSGIRLIQRQQHSGGHEAHHE